VSAATASAALHLEAARGYIAVAESGDAKREAYRKAADEILAAMTEDDSLTQRKVGERIGKGHAWVGKLLRWAGSPENQGLPFARDPENDFRAKHEERKIPTRHEDKVEMAKTLIADKKVAKQVLAERGPARRAMQQAVRDENKADREKAREWNEQRTVGAPLPAWLSSMAVKLSDWGLAIAGLRDNFADELRELPPSTDREVVARAAYELARQARLLGDDLSDDPNVIEASVIELTGTR
jgi:hypothetical protein